MPADQRPKGYHADIVSILSNFAQLELMKLEAKMEAPVKLRRKSEKTATFAARCPYTEMAELMAKMEHDGTLFRGDQQVPGFSQPDMTP